MSGNIQLLTDTLAGAKAEGRSALIAYLPAGFPTVDGGIEAIKAAFDGVPTSSRSGCRTATRSSTVPSSRPPTTSPCAAASRSPTSCAR